MAGRFSKKKLGSQSSLREANRANLLESIHKFGAMTQVELAEIMGVSTATISALVHQLVDEGQLETQGTVRNGRRAQLVTLAHHQGLAAVHITRRGLRVVLCDDTRTPFADHYYPLPQRHLPDTTLDVVIRLIRESLDQMGAQPSELFAIGVALGAPVDSRSHMLAVPGLLPGWEEVDVGAVLESAFGVPVLVDNDANLSAFCEARVGAGAGIEDFVYVNASDGVGAGIVEGGEIRRGITGLAGEIGHIQVDPLGSICQCGNRGCLNTVVDEQRLTSLLAVTHGNLTLNDLVAKANEGDPGCRRVIADAAVRIGNVTSTLCISVDPELVVVGGELARAGDVFLEPFRESLQRLLFPDALTPISVLEAKMPKISAALGAGILAMEGVERASINGGTQSEG
ncbi:NagC/XylR family repressor [Bifidobacterium animalis subsp. animalis IM386]|uniref:NagC/XylR family repressor n=1 Tax=Bifidobacterium animalis subsp. animalis IM386 TaxID=1402194 RepID=A0AAV2W140_9BIFI|nr:ROK family transcriptional regulator [Bifidobacterium animalis]CDI67113.1 NagC/XylR family repressor [Bifidobacterium animalis subsp. animalis IM386]